VFRRAMQHAAANIAAGMRGIRHCRQPDITE
jgi:hypothetical protein